MRGDDVIPNTFAPEGASRCRALTSGLLDRSAGRKENLSDERAGLNTRQRPKSRKLAEKARLSSPGRSPHLAQVCCFEANSIHETHPPSCLGVLAGSAAAIGLPSAWYSRMKTYSGPVSDHFDGLQFYDPDGSPPKSLAQVLRWQLGRGRQRAVWPEWAPSPHADTPPPRIEGDKVRLSFVGHASWLIQAAGLNILVDPVWSERVSPLSFAGPKRRNDPGIAFEALPKIDIVLVSHGHYDHLDIATLSKLAAKFSPRQI